MSMPGQSYRGPLPPLTDAQRDLAAQLQREVEHLAGTIGPRNTVAYDNLQLAAAYLNDRLTAIGYAVTRLTYDVEGNACENLVVERPGDANADEIVIIGAHYDSVWGSPGANDNASAVAALLAMAEHFADRQPMRTLRFVFFVNEEPPHFQTEHMGSLLYASRCKQRNENVVAMIAMDGLGCYFDEPGTQKYPFPFSLFYPSTGNFIGIVGNTGSRQLVRDVIGSFRRQVQFPSEGAALPGFIPEAGFSDHWAFWQVGYPGVMVTDSLPFRYPHYHDVTDTPDQLDYERMARVVEGLEMVVADLAGIADKSEASTKPQ